MHPRPDGSCIATFLDAYTFVHDLQMWANDIVHGMYQCQSVVEKSFFQASPTNINVLILSSLMQCLTLSIMSYVATAPPSLLPSSSSPVKADCRH